MLTKRDFDEIEKIVEEKVGEKTKNLPTKDEFFEKMDEVVGELKAICEEHTILSSQVSGYEDRIPNLKKSTRPALIQLFKSCEGLRLNPCPEFIEGSFLPTFPNRLLRIQYVYKIN